MHKKNIMRIEKDFLGSLEIPDDAYYGIHSLRAKNNFNNTTPFHIEWYQAMGLIKLACYNTYERFATSVKNNNLEHKIRLIDIPIIKTLQKAAHEVSQGKYFEHFIVPAIQGGAGTSINMNINEIIANVALIQMNYKPGQYEIIDPIEHANVYQSTNDTVASALKIATIFLLEKLEEAINKTRHELEQLEKKFRNVLRIGYTQLQEAVPGTFGKLFSAYNDALSRDWWRTSKAFERIKVINLGGGAIGTGLAIPRFVIMEVVQELQRISNLPIARGENLVDATQNVDSFVEVHAILKAHAVNLEKIANDIRLLSADIGPKVLNVNAFQAGSSIMPGKVNPVISEYLITIAHKVYANDMLISNLCGQSNLELNAYIPIIGHALLESIKLLISANQSLYNKLLPGLSVNSEISYQQLIHSPTITTALIPYIGYHKATEIALYMKNHHVDIFEANNNLQFIDNNKLNQILTADNLTKLGFSLKEL